MKSNYSHRIMPCLKTAFPLILCIITACWQGTVTAQIDSSLRKIKDLQFKQIVRTESLPAEEKVGEFPGGLLQEYGFLSYSSWKIQPIGIQLSVYEMSDTQAAFGLFTQWRLEEREQRFPNHPSGDNLLIDNDMALWEGHYLLVAEGIALQQSQLTSLPRSLRESINERNLYPTSVFELPKKELIPDSIRLYLGPETLRKNLAIPDYLISELGFKDEAEIASAQYGSEGELLLLAAYPTYHLAIEYAARIRDAIESNVGSTFYLKLSGPLLGIYLGERESAEKVLGDLRYSASIKWVQDKVPPLPNLAEHQKEVQTLLGVVSGSMVLTGVFILTVLFAGLLLGVIRVLLIHRFPILKPKNGGIYLDLNSSSAERAQARQESLPRVDDTTETPGPL